MSVICMTLRLFGKETSYSEESDGQQETGKLPETTEYQESESDIGTETRSRRRTGHLNGGHVTQKDSQKHYTRFISCVWRLTDSLSSVGSDLEAVFWYLPGLELTNLLPAGTAARTQSDPGNRKTPGNSRQTISHRWKTHRVTR